MDLPHLALSTINTEFHLGVPLIDHLNIRPLCGIKFKFTGNRSRSTDELDGHKLLSFLSKQLTYWPQDCSERYLQAIIDSGGKIRFGNSKRVGQDSYMT